MGCRKECYKVQIIIMKLAFFFQHTDTFDQHFFTILGEGPPLLDPPVPWWEFCAVLCREMRALGDINIYAVFDYRVF